MVSIPAADFRRLHMRLIPHGRVYYRLYGDGSSAGQPIV